MKKKDKANIEYIFCVMLVIIVTLLVAFIIKIRSYELRKIYIEDSLTDANLSCLILDPIEYGKSGGVSLDNAEKSLDIFKKILSDSLNLTNMTPKNNDIVLTNDKIDIIDFFIYEGISGDVFQTQIINNKEKQIIQNKVLVGKVDNYKTPDGTLIEENTISVYSKIGFYIKTMNLNLFGSDIDTIKQYKQKEQTVDIISEEIIHEYDNGIIIEEPGCYKPGIMMYTCKDCGYVRYKSIEPLGYTPLSFFSNYYLDYNNNTITIRGTYNHCEGGLLIDNMYNACYIGNETDIVIPEYYNIDGINYKVISLDGCFNGKKITSIQLPDTLEYIGFGTFNNTQLASIIIPNNVTTIGKSAFSYNNDLKYIELPNNLYCIGSYAFSNCPNIEVILLPNNTYSYFGGYLFNECTNLLIARLPETITSIPTGIFNGCIKLISVFIPNTVNNINNTSFRNCTSLTTIVIPKSINNISNDAFYGCNSLINVYYTGNLSQWNNIIINNGNECLINSEKYYNYSK